MAFAAPDNEGLLSQLTPQEQSEYKRWRGKAEAAAAAKPYLKTEVYTHYLHDYIDAAVGHKAHMEDFKKRAAAANIPLDKKALDAESSKFKNEFAARFQRDVLPGYGPQGQEAWTALAEKMERPNLLTGGIKQVYNSEEGGFQWGGIVGGIVGAFAAAKLTGFSLGGLFSGELDLFSILGMVVGVGMGAVTGNMIGNWMGPGSSERKPFPGTDIATKQPEKSAGTEVAQKPSLSSVLPGYTTSCAGPPFTVVNPDGSVPLPPSGVPHKPKGPVKPGMPPQGNPR